MNNEKESPFAFVGLLLAAGFVFFLYKLEDNDRQKSRNESVTAESPNLLGVNFRLETAGLLTVKIPAEHISINEHFFQSAFADARASNYKVVVQYQRTANTYESDPVEFAFDFKAGHTYKVCASEDMNITDFSNPHSEVRFWMVDATTGTVVWGVRPPPPMTQKDIEKAIEEYRSR
jgi:hypothetical protein